MDNYINPWVDRKAKRVRCTPLPDSAFSERRREDRRFLIQITACLILFAIVGALAVVGGILAVHTGLEFLARKGF